MPLYKCKQKTGFKPPTNFIINITTINSATLYESNGFVKRPFTNTEKTLTFTQLNQNQSYSIQGTHDNVISSSKLTVTRTIQVLNADTNEDVTDFVNTLSIEYTENLKYANVNINLNSGTNTFNNSTIVNSTRNTNAGHSEAGLKCILSATLKVTEITWKN